MASISKILREIIESVMYWCASRIHVWCIRAESGEFVIFSGQYQVPQLYLRLVCNSYTHIRKDCILKFVTINPRASDSHHSSGTFLLTDVVHNLKYFDSCVAEYVFEAIKKINSNIQYSHFKAPMHIPTDRARKYCLKLFLILM